MKWIVFFWLPFVAGCKKTKFVKEEGMALENHVIKTVTAATPIKCQWDCVDIPLCFSVNVRILPTGRVTCELNNSSKTADPQDLISSAGIQYHQMEEVEHCTREECVYKDALLDGWYRFGAKLIKLFPEKRTWEQAQQFCQSIGGELVSINREDENELLYHLLAQIKTNTTAKDANQTITHWILDGTDSDVSLENGAIYKEEDGVKSLYLNGSGAYATTPAVDFGTPSFTIASWVKLQSPVNDPSPLYADWSDPVKFIIYAYSGGNLFLGAYNNENQFMPWFGAGPTPVDKWFHVAAVWDGITNKVHLFLNGERYGSQAVPSGSYPKKNSHSVYDIGLKRDSGETLRGYVRNLMIVKRALTGEELTDSTDPFGGVWIGLNDVTKEGTFSWPDGIHVTYTKWSSNLPDNQNEYKDCVRMTVIKGAWDETSCEKQLPFVCEKKT
ncbi:hypothetical protein ACROYT_G028752 [Oculina patagonica]